MSESGRVEPTIRSGTSGRERHLAVLQAILQVTAGTIEEEGLERSALEAFVETLPADRVELLLSDGVRLIVERSGEGLRFTQEARRTGESAAGAGLSWHALELPSVGWDTDAAGGTVHVVTVALRGRERPLGVLRFTRSGGMFQPDDIGLLSDLGRHLGVAVQHARLFRRAASEAERLEHAVAERSVALEDTRAQLARSHWLTALGQLAAGVAHDLNNALNPIIAFAELIKVQAHDPESVRSYADRVLLAARDGAETVRRIKRFTRRSGGGVPREPVLLHEIVRETVELARPTWQDRLAGGRVGVIEVVDPALSIRGNAAELREALLNLVNNALDAMPSGGVLRFVGRREGDRAVLAVQDSGEGMPPEILGRVLEPFYTTREPKGTGLGLPQVYGIVRRHGGELEIESWPGCGTTVLMSFPAITTPVPAAAPVAASAVVRRRLSILLVDDNVLSMEAMAAALRAAGHDIATAETAEQALELFAPGKFDWVLTDLALPRRSGWDLLLELRRMQVDVRLGVLTGWSVDEAEERLRSEGVELLLHKPVDPQELLSALSESQPQF